MKTPRSFAWLSLGVLLACGRESASRPAPAGPPVQVAAYRVGAAAGREWYEAAGTVRALHRAELATRLTGTIQTVRVRAGDRVAAGQLLLTLDAGSPQAGLSQARAALELATITLKRMERLYADSAIPAAQLDAARAAHAQAESQARAAEVDVGYGGLRAPFSGVVTARLADPGDLAVPGRPLLVIEGAGAKEIVIGVPDDLLGGIRPGMRMAIRIGAGEQLMEAQVTAVVPVADPETRTAEVRLSAPADLTTGASAVAQIPLGGVRGLRVPATALIHRGQLVGVLLFAADSTLRLRWIRIGRLEGAGAEVLAGLAAGDLIALQPDALDDGTRALPRLAPSVP